MKALLLGLSLTSLAMAETNLELMQRLVNEEAHGKVVGTFDTPKYQTANSLEYSFHEMKLRPKEVLYFHVPDQHSTRPISQLAFAHRQKGHLVGRDPYPGLTSALVYSKDVAGDELRYWAGHASGKLGAKFAEYRSSPEFDALYEWPKVGHKGIKNKNTSRDLIRPNVVRIQNVGVDDIYLSKLYLETLPTRAQEYQTVIFTPRSDFGDPETLEGRYYGGGQNQRGRFPEALKLSSRQRPHGKLPDNIIHSGHELRIKLPAGRRLTGVDIMCGDTHPDGVRNQDGGWGSLGNAKITVSIQNKKTDEKRILLYEKNVGPQGVLSASDVSADLTFIDGDELVIENKYNRSTAYIMGLRLGFNP